MNKNFQIFRSSAGSGKTYTLVLKFIAIAIKGGRYGYQDYYRKILAVTFTNKAAAEMKERVLEYLCSLEKQEDKDGIIDWLKKETKFSEAEIFKRAGLIHKHILHNQNYICYSQPFQKFMVKCQHLIDKAQRFFKYVNICSDFH